MGRRYVLTGATSFIGKALVEELVQRGHTVYAIVRPSSRQRDIFRGRRNVITVLADMNDTERWKKQIVEADGFFHLGWDGIGAKGRSNPEVQCKNVEDTLMCLKAAAEIGCSCFMFAGSQAEYGPHSKSITEETSCCPVIEYGKGKLQVWQRAYSIAQQCGIVYYHARIFSVYGEGDHPWAMVPSTIRTLLNGEEMKMTSCTQIWNYMYLPDAARVLCMLMESGAKGGIYNVASQDTRPLSDFVRCIHEQCNYKGKLSFGVYKPSEAPVNLIPDISRLRAAIGPIPETDFAEGIRAIIQKEFNERTVQ